jgi:hypothetical protein
LGQVWSNLADAYWRVGRTKDAFAAVERARPLLAGPDYADAPWYAANLDSIEGAIRTGSGERGAAERLLTSSYPIVAEHWGDGGLYTRLAAERLARFYDSRGDAALARRYREVIR